MKFCNQSLIRAKMEHYDDYYEIRCEDKNLFWTGYSNPPNYMKFREWYQQRLNDTNRHIYLIYNEEESLGSLHIDFYENYAAIGYSVKKTHEGKGIGTKLVNEAINLVKNEKERRSDLKYIKAWINQSNIASIKIVKKNKFNIVNKEIRKRFGQNEVYLEFVLNLEG